jgi:hypothetical protein
VLRVVKLRQRSRYRPRPACGQVVLAVLLDGSVELVSNLGVVDRAVDGAEDTDRCVVQGVRVGEAGEGEGRGRGRGVRVVDHDRGPVLGCHGDDLQIAGQLIPYNPAGAVCAQADRLPCSRRITTSSACCRSFSASKAPSLKMLQFW